VVWTNSSSVKRLMIVISQWNGFSSTELAPSFEIILLYNLSVWQTAGPCISTVESGCRSGAEAAVRLVLWGSVTPIEKFRSSTPELDIILSKNKLRLFLGLLLVTKT